MKNIKSNSVMESFGMKEMDVEELMQISGGRLPCVTAINCPSKCICHGGKNYNPCTAKAVL